MKAILKPRFQSPHAKDLEVTLLARTSNGKITIERRADRRIYSVDRYLLHTEGVPARRITEDEFAALPWRGKGPDRECKAAGDLLGATSRSDSGATP